MEGYLGESLVKVEKTKAEWVLIWLERYRGIDGDHHKDWLTDQIAQILNGTEVVSKVAKWKCGHEEWRYSLGEPSQKYHKWVAEMRNGEDGPNTYSYDQGIAP